MLYKKPHKTSLVPRTDEPGGLRTPTSPRGPNEWGIRLSEAAHSTPGVERSNAQTMFSPTLVQEVKVYDEPDV